MCASSVVRWAVIGSSAVAILIGAFALYALGRSQSGYDWVKLRREAEQRRLVAEVRRLRGENQRLSARVVQLERGGEYLDKRAAGVLDKSLRDEQVEWPR